MPKSKQVPRLNPITTWLTNMGVHVDEWRSHAQLLELLYPSYEKILQPDDLIKNLHDYLTQTHTPSAQRVIKKALQIARHNNQLYQRYLNRPAKLYQQVFQRRAQRAIDIRFTAVALILTLPEDIFLSTTRLIHTYGAYKTEKTYPIILLNTGGVYSNALTIPEMLKNCQHEFTHAMFDQLFANENNTFTEFSSPWNTLRNDPKKHRRYAAHLTEWINAELRSEIIAYAGQGEFNHSLQALGINGWLRRLPEINGIIVESGLSFDEQKVLYQVYLEACQRTVEDIELYLRFAQAWYALYRTGDITYCQYMSALMLTNFEQCRKIFFLKKHSPIYAEICSWMVRKSLRFQKQPPTVLIKKLIKQKSVRLEIILAALKRLPRDLPPSWEGVTQLLYRHSDHATGLDALLYAARYSPDSMVGYDAISLLAVNVRKQKNPLPQRNAIMQTCRYIIKKYRRTEPRVTSAKALLRDMLQSQP